MRVEIIRKGYAIEKSALLRDRAWDIAKSYGTVPGFCDNIVCRQFTDYLGVSTLKENEGCIFVDGLAAMQLTNFKLSKNLYALGRICGVQMDAAYIYDNELCIKFTDGLIEYYKYHDQADAWYFDRNSANVDFKLPQTSMT